MKENPIGGRPKLRDIWPKVVTLLDFMAIHEILDEANSNPKVEIAGKMVNCLSLGSGTQKLEEKNGKVVMHKDKKYYYQCLVCTMVSHLMANQVRTLY